MEGGVKRREEGGGWREREKGKRGGEGCKRGWDKGKRNCKTLTKERRKKAIRQGDKKKRQEGEREGK